MIITANGDYPMPSFPGEFYIFAVSGNMDGARCSLQWSPDDVTWNDFANAAFEDGPGTMIVCAPSYFVRFRVTGGGVPDFVALLSQTAVQYGAQGSGGTPPPKVIDVLNRDERFALSAAEVNKCDIVREVGQSAVIRVTARADASGVLNSTAFILQTTDGYAYFWFNVDGVGSDPGVGDFGIEVPISTGDSAVTVASAIKLAAESNNTDYWRRIQLDGEEVTFVALTNGWRDAYDDASGVGIDYVVEGLDGTGQIFTVVDLNNLSNEAGYARYSLFTNEGELLDSSISDKAISPSTLSTWWNSIKNIALTLGQNLTLNGTNNTAPGQGSLTSSNSLVTRALLANEGVFGYPQYWNFDLGLAQIVNSANASGGSEPGIVKLRLTSGAVSGNYSAATLLYEFNASSAGGGTTAYANHWFMLFHTSGFIANNINLKIHVGVTAGKTGEMDDLGVGLRLDTNSTVRLRYHNGTTLTESGAITVPTFQDQYFLLENIGNGTLNLYVLGANASPRRFFAVPSITMTGGPSSYGVGNATQKFCVVAQYLATGTTTQNSTFFIKGGRVFFP